MVSLIFIRTNYLFSPFTRNVTYFNIFSICNFLAGPLFTKKNVNGGFNPKPAPCARFFSQRFLIIWAVHTSSRTIVYRLSSSSPGLRSLPFRIFRGLSFLSLLTVFVVVISVERKERDGGGAPLLRLLLAFGLPSQHPHPILFDQSSLASPPQMSDVPVTRTRKVTFLDH